ncbi:ABC transporter ATP-binding protein [Patescibacteria group bacterium]|nr:ABC transporter ATP-binding protein [Patescibacteria group bacterium]
MALKIENLFVRVEGKDVLKGVGLEVKAGEVVALMGPNGSGKSSLAGVIMGFEKYLITRGSIKFDGKIINKCKIEERAKKGLALVMQNVPEIEGVSLSELIRIIKKVDVNKDDSLLGNDFLKRDVNKDFSGGERKMSEMMQIMALNPKMVIFDEIDSGLDVKKMKKISLMIKNKLVKRGAGVLIITHRAEILRYLKPKIVGVMLKGKIVCMSDNWKKVWNTINQHGYEKCKNC